MFTRLTLASLAVLAAGSLAQAHDGARIFLGNVNGQVTTYFGNNDQDSTSFVQQRIFTQPLPNFLNTGIYTTDFPGFQVVEGTGIPSDSTFSFTIAGPLYYFANYNASVGTGTFLPVAQAFAGGTIPQLAVSQEDMISITAEGRVSGFDFFTYNEPGDHGHNSYTLYGNGTSASNGASGVYLLPLEVTGTTLATSETFYLLLGKDVAVPSVQMDAAVNAASAQFVPEPSIALFITPWAAILLRRR